MNRILIPLLAIAMAVAGWFAAKEDWLSLLHPTKATADSGARKILYYQSAMHPWIKSDKPGKCTICGMNLTPVYEGEKGYAAEPGIVVLPQSSITVLNVQTVPVKRAPLVRTLRFAGNIDDDDTKHRVISAYVPGRIEKLHANFVGMEVKAGDPLLDIYSPTLLTAEREYVGVLKGLGSSRESVSGARVRLQRMGLSDAEIDALPKKAPGESASQLLAPISGTVVNKMVYAGQYVEEGKAMLELADFSTMWLMFRAYEHDLPFIKIGQEVEATTPSLPGQVLRGTVTFIDPNLEEATRSAKVRVDLPNPDRAIKHRLYTEARVRATVPDVLQIPRLAVLSPGGNPVVYTDAGGGAYERRAVKLGRLGDDAWEVTSGLSEDDKVVVAGNLLIDSQSQLNDNSAAPAPAVPEPAAPKKTDATPVKAWPLATCPVTNEELGSMGAPVVFVFDGQQVKLCCKVCKPKFDAEPQKFLAILNITKP